MAQVTPWQDLFRWQEEYRRKNNLTPCQFLRAIGSQVCSYNVKYLQDPTKIPSMGASGLAIRNKIQAATEDQSLIQPPSITRDQEFADYVIENEKKLLSCGILSIAHATQNDGSIDVDVLLSVRNPDYIIREVFNPFKLGKIKTEIFVSAW